MGWASKYIEQLQCGEVVQFRPSGNSMTPRIKSKQLVTVEPLGDAALAVGDIVLCKVNGREFLHLIRSSRRDGDEIVYQIGNNKGFINGWTKAVFGRLSKVED